MQVVVNGESRKIKADSTVSELLAELGFRPERVAVERNLEVVRRATWDQARLQAGDVIEILTFVGGG